MTAAEINEARPKPWRWRRCQTTFALEDANGKAIGIFHLSRKMPTNQHEFMRHVAKELADVSAMIAPEESSDEH